jgi:hypothetical protein
VKYVILIYSNPASREIWDSIPVDQRAEGLKVYEALVADLEQSGELIVTEALADPSSAQRVSVEGERTVTSDWLLPRRLRERGAGDRDRGTRAGGRPRPGRAAAGQGARGLPDLTGEFGFRLPQGGQSLPDGAPAGRARSGP